MAPRLPRPERGPVVDNPVHIRHRSSLTRHTFPGSLVGIGEGGGVPACRRVYMKCGDRA
jgi:hypothetical protein